MLIEQVWQTIQKYNLIQSGDNIVIGVSGGPDSMTLLDVLSTLKQRIDIQLYVAHVNHGIRQEAIEDQNYVQQACQRYKIPCFVKQIQIEEIAKQQKIGIEEAGRKERYSFFEQIAKQTQSNKIATAHTENDNAETILMNLMRGSGLIGLKGIEPIRNNRYIRPLIECQRQEIERYCKEKKIQPKIDKTNQENTYTRNRIRNELIPYLKKEFNPNIIGTLNRLADIVKEENNYLEKQVKVAYEKMLLEERDTQIILDLKEFNQSDLVIKKRIVLYTITRLFGTSSGIEKIHIEDIIKLCGNNIGNKFLIPNKKVKILIKNKKIFFVKNETIRKKNV